MKLGKIMARKAKHASTATRRYFGYGIADNHPNDAGKTQRAADAGQARTKIRRVFES